MVSDRFEFRKEQVVEKERILPVSGRKEVVIAGGGVAGIAAAIAAGRNGAKTLLVERLGFLGGIATAGLMYMAFAPYGTTSGIGRELYTKMVEIGAGIDDVLLPFDAEQFKFHALNTTSEAGVDLLFHSMIVDTVTIRNQVKGVVVENKSGRSVVLSDVVIDATGDCDVAARAGAPFVKGREKDGKMRPISLLFRMGGINTEKLIKYVNDHPHEFTKDPNKNVLLPEKGFYRLVGFFSLVEDAIKKGEIDPGLHYVRVECFSPKTSIAMINTTRVYDVDGTDAIDISNSEIAARRQMMELVEVFRKYFPGFEKSFLIDSASMLGVRETRRIIGDYILTEEDVAEKKRFPRIVARNASRIAPGTDVHSPDGTEGSIRDSRHRDFVDELYWHGVPYDCLLPKHIENLLVAGRCISATHDAEKWTRVQTCCMATGEAAGTAAALSVRNRIPPRRLAIAELQNVLVSQGVKLDY